MDYPDTAEALKACTPGELAFLAERAQTYAALQHQGVAGVGRALARLVAAEQDCRALDRARLHAESDAVLAMLVDPNPGIGDVRDIPPWSQVS